MSDYTEEQVDRAIDHVIRHGAENRGATVIYSIVFEAAGLAAPQHLYNGGDGRLVTEFMEAFHGRCKERSLPPLDSLVINATGARGGMPGPGYFRVNGLLDPLKPSTSPEDAARSTAAMDAQRAECREWGKAHRALRRAGGD